MARDWARLDEDDVRVRPGRGSRPRTRRRPAHDDAVGGFVLAVDRGRYTCLVDERPVTAMRARELGRKSVVVGDRVRLVGDVSGRPDTLARVVAIEPRTSTLRRTADDSDPVERVIVANADNLVIVTALADPPPRPRMIDRCLVAAFDAGLAPVLCLTKADLAAPDALEEMYAPLGVTYVVTRKDRPVDDLRAHLAGRMSVLVGHSGVGKSTLVNALVPDAERAVSAVNPVTGRGRHTSSSAIALALPDGDGWIIDTPGVRSFGLAHVKPDDVLAAFPDLIEGDAECPPHCTHVQDDCALDAWVAAGNADPSRLDSLRRLLLSRDTDEA
ncbi:ribosome small subunit-dependent GTPase A [Actinoallomurus iriomotensis]|jgi:ribosome biogenesis GTPase / thiamine phosphate phosphatase|uniref:Small ribosomal subunit biogenesis GTPase RsgA n=1 Tax=Actinoallomurus iriomotensis TaxID=478107 RepID=A0A9W6RCI6_9ACTN|nr:ribosome small subunit-dependent GTPase A [Actinoallomurus iriomotensis]GLY73094.1 putative ribosome biogenesis GTPase RsgA [Actinoallomurus iriomotensis]